MHSPTRTDNPVLFAFDQADIPPTPGAGSSSDQALALLRAKEIATEFASNCLRFIDAHNIFDVARRKITIDTSDSSELEKHLPQKEHTKQVETFFYQAQVCLNLSESQSSPIMQQTLLAMINMAKALMNCAAKSLTHYYDTSLSSEAQKAALECIGGKFQTIVDISKAEAPAVRPDRAAPRPSLPEELKRDIAKKVKL